MAVQDVFTGPGGSSGNSGLSYPLRKLTVAQGLAVLATAGDRLIIAPGTYREGSLGAPSITLSNYTAGTVSVTNGSAVVTGSGTTWSGNIFANGIFQIQAIAHGTDGVTNGTGTFTSSAGNFQSGMIGMTIRINTKAAYLISAVGSTTSITLTDITGAAVTPSAGSSLTYDVGPESPYEISSVDSNTQITLKNKWSGPSLTGESYLAWRDVKIIGDESGALTDGIGGEIRLTGSDNDTSVTRASAFTTGRSNMTYRGIHFDMYSAGAITFTAGINCIFEQCVFHDTTGAISLTGALPGNTIRKCVVRASAASVTVYIALQHSSATQDNQAILVENLLLIGPTVNGNQAIGIARLGGVLVRNVDFINCATAVRVSTAGATGQCTSVNNCVLQADSVGFQGVATTDILEDYNAIYANGTARSNTSIGAHSQTYAGLFAAPLLTLGITTDIFDLMMSVSPLGSIAGLNAPVDDLYGETRAATSSWGCVQYSAGEVPIDRPPFPAGMRGGLAV